jgi:hypothetical protein
MEATCSSKLSVSIYNPTQCQNPEDCHLRYVTDCQQTELRLSFQSLTESAIFIYNIKLSGLRFACRFSSATGHPNDNTSDFLNPQKILAYFKTSHCFGAWVLTVNYQRTP